MSVTTQNDLPIGHELVEGVVHYAVTIYGTEGCIDTTRVRDLLNRLGIEYNYYNVDLDPAIERTMLALSNGSPKTPVVKIDDRVLIEPADDVVINALQETGRLHSAA